MFPRKPQKKQQTSLTFTRFTCLELHLVEHQLANRLESELRSIGLWVKKVYPKQLIGKRMNQNLRCLGFFLFDPIYTYSGVFFGSFYTQKVVPWGDFCGLNLDSSLLFLFFNLFFPGFPLIFSSLFFHPVVPVVHRIFRWYFVCFRGLFVALMGSPFGCSAFCRCLLLLLSRWRRGVWCFLVLVMICDLVHIIGAFDFWCEIDSSKILQSLFRLRILILLLWCNEHLCLLLQQLWFLRSAASSSSGLHINLHRVYGGN